MVKCPNCDKIISSISWETVGASPFGGGSDSYVAVASPCKHLVPAVPALWESYLIQINKKLGDPR